MLNVDFQKTTWKLSFCTFLVTMMQTLAVYGQRAPTYNIILNAKTTATSPAIELNWNVLPARNGVIYSVKRSATKNGVYNLIASQIKVNPLKYVDAQVQQNKTYYYMVTTVIDGKTINSNSVEATSKKSSSASTNGSSNLSTPTDIFTSAKDGKVIVSWSKISEDNDKKNPTLKVLYSLSRSTRSGGGYAVLASDIKKSYSSLGGGVELSTITYEDKTVTNGTTYYYVVKARVFNSQSNDSIEVSARPDSAPKALQLTANAKNVGSVELSWSSTSTTNVRYNIARSTHPTAFYNWIYNWTAFSKTSYTDMDVQSGRTYYYKMVAENDFGSTESAVVSVTAKATAFEQACFDAAGGVDNASVSNIDGRETCVIEYKQTSPVPKCPNVNYVVSTKRKYDPPLNSDGSDGSRGDKSIIYCVNKSVSCHNNTDGSRECYFYNMPMINQNAKDFVAAGTDGYYCGPTSATMALNTVIAGAAETNKPIKGTVAYDVFNQPSTKDQVNKMAFYLGTTQFGTSWLSDGNCVSIATLGTLFAGMNCYPSLYTNFSLDNNWKGNLNSWSWARQGLNFLSPKGYTPYLGHKDEFTNKMIEDIENDRVPVIGYTHWNYKTGIVNYWSYDGGHYNAVRGYKIDTNGKVKFQLYDPWGSKNGDISWGKDLWREISEDGGAGLFLNWTERDSHYFPAIEYKATLRAF